MAKKEEKVTRISLEDVKKKALIHKEVIKEGEDSKKKEEKVGLFNNEPNITYEVIGGKAVIKGNDNKRNKTQSINVDEIIDSILGVHKFNINKVKRAKELIHNFPDLGLAGEIFVSSILSPNLLSTITFNQEITSNWIPDSLSTTAIAYLSDELTDYYDLTNTLYKKVETSFVKSGAYCELMIPDNTLDKHIQGVLDAGDLVTETFAKPLLANSVVTKDSTAIDIGAGMTLFSDTDIVGLIDDNFTIESHKSKDKKKDIEHFFKEVYGKKPIAGRSLYTSQSDENKSRPMRMEVPMESVIPIHVKTDPSKHLGYFIVLDEDGSPIRDLEEITKEVDNKENEVFNGEILTNEQVQNRNKKKKIQMSKTPTLDNISSLSQEILTREVKGFLEQKGLDKYLDDTLANTLYKIMFFRANKALKTNVLFVPKEELFYMAFEYDDNGTGVSILDGMGDLASDRMALLTAKLHAQIKNLIPDTLYDITIDEDDQDPESTVKEVILSILEARGGVIPNMDGKLDRVSYSNWAQKLGISLKVNNPKLPTLEVNKDIQYQSYNEPDTDLEDEIKTKMYMKFSLTSEMVTKGIEGEFATSVRINNALFTKRIIQRQIAIEGMLTEYIKMIIRNDGVVFKSLQKIIKDNYDTLNKSFTKEAKEYLSDKGLNSDNMLDMMLDEIRNTIKLQLIRPEDETKDSLDDAYDDYLDFVEEYLDRNISDENLPDKFLEVFDGDIDKLKMFTKNKLLNKWMANNNYYTELIDLFAFKEDGTPDTAIFSDYNTYAKNIVDTFEAYVKGLESKESYYKEVESVDEGSDDTPPDDNTPPDDDSTLPPPTEEDGGSTEEGSDSTEDTPPEDETTQSFKESNLSRGKLRKRDREIKKRPKSRKRVGAKSEEYFASIKAEDMNSESFTGNEGTSITDTIKVKPTIKELYQLSLELSVGSTRKLLSTVKGKGNPNRYHARVCCELLYPTVTDSNLESMNAFLKELKHSNYYSSFLSSIVKQGYADGLLTKLFSETNNSAIGLSPTLRAMINDNVYEECQTKFNTTNSLYVTHANYSSISVELLDMISNLGTEFSTIDGDVELNPNSSNYMDVLDPNNIYYMGEKYIKIEESDNLRALYHNINVPSTIRFHEALKSGDDRVLRSYGVDREYNDYESLRFCVIFDKVNKAVSLLNVDELDWLPKAPRKVINPLHAQRARLMLLNYETSLNKEFMNSKIPKRDGEYVHTEETVKLGVYPLHCKNVEEPFKKEDAFDVISASERLNLSLLIHLSITKENSREGKYTNGMLEELKSMYSNKVLKDYCVESYFDNTPKPIDLGTEEVVIDLPWNTVHKVINSVLTTEAYNVDSIAKDSPMARYMFKKASHISEILKVQKREVITKILENKGSYTDDEGREYGEGYFYIKGKLSNERLDSVRMPFERYGISKPEFEKMISNININKTSKDLPNDVFDVDEFIEMISEDSKIRDKFGEAIRKQLR